jgi:hypothetical protein
VPSSLTQWATPYGLRAEDKDYGFFAQDQWNLQRMTVTAGVRWEYFNGYNPPQSVPATPNGWVPARSFGEVKNVPNWKDLDPRLGVAYDVRGNGRTALKIAIGRYVSKAAITVPQANNPVQTSINSVTRTGRQLHRRRPAPRQPFPAAVFRRRGLNGECGARPTRISAATPPPFTRTCPARLRRGQLDFTAGAPGGRACMSAVP